MNRPKWFINCSFLLEQVKKARRDTDSVSISTQTSRRNYIQIGSNPWPERESGKVFGSFTCMPGKTSIADTISSGRNRCLAFRRASHIESVNQKEHPGMDVSPTLPQSPLNSPQKIVRGPKKCMIALVMWFEILRTASLPLFLCTGQAGTSVHRYLRGKWLLKWFSGGF